DRPPAAAVRHKPIRKATVLVAGIVLVALSAGGLGGYMLRGRTSSAAGSNNPRIPAEVSYPIIEEIIKPPRKISGVPRVRTLHVRLNVKVSPEILREIGLAIKSTEAEQYDRTFIFYYLPDSGPEAINGNLAPWAYTHFDPTLRVEIMGLTAE